MKIKQITGLLCLAVLMALTFSCATSAGQLRQANNALESGNYVEAVSLAINSYEIAVEKDKKPEEIQEAKDFLINVFPTANSTLSSQAEAMESGDVNSQVKAYEVWGTLVSMNQEAEASTASTFLDVQDFTAQWEAAKELAASIYYDTAEDFAKGSSRDDQINAFTYYSYANVVIPQYRDATEKMTIARENATITVALVNDYSIKVQPTVDGELIQGVSSFERELLATAKQSIINQDDERFLNFIERSSMNEARNSGADYAIRPFGEILIRSSVDNFYSSQGIVTMYRDYNAQVKFECTNFLTGTTENAFFGAFFDQTLNIRFLTHYENGNEMPQSVYDQLHDEAYINKQLSDLKTDMARDEMDVNAHIQIYGGLENGELFFWNNAWVEGVGEMPVNFNAWFDVNSYMSTLLREFYTFEDMWDQPVDRVVLERLQARIMDTESNTILTMFQSFQ